MKLIILLLAISVFISSCSSPTGEVVKEVPEYVGEITETNMIEEEAEIVTDIEAETIEEVKLVPEEKISEEVMDLLNFADTRVKSLSYRYRGPETKGRFYEFYMVGNKIKYTISPTYKDPHLDDDAYDTIYVNKEFETALAYCEGRKCRIKGKKAVLDYDESYIWTSLDWINNMEYAEKVGEELINRRSTSKLEAGSLGTIWIDNYLGVAVQTENDENLYQFRDIVLNAVKNRDVTPK